MVKYAVYVDRSGMTALITEKGTIRMYSKDDIGWSIVKEARVELDFSKGIREIRLQLDKMVEQLEDCRIFIAKEISGQLYYVLEANNYNTYEAEGKPEVYLDSIWDSEHAALKQDIGNELDQAAEADRVKLQPIQIEQSGVYHFDLGRALKSDCSLTSKQLLKPFLRNKEFKYLEIICDHVPRWFETDLQIIGLNATTTKIDDNEYKVMITPVK